MSHPENYNYGVTWESVKLLFKKQFVPESAISVIRKEWHALKFNRTQILRFNQRALELVTILGGSLTITRENPLWEEYLQKLPESTANDIAQQARLMSVLTETKLTPSGMMDIVAERTLPFLPPASFSAGTTGDPVLASTGAAGHYDPMDLSNMDEELNAVDGSAKCYRCSGMGHIACQCPSPNLNSGPTSRSTQFRARQQAHVQQPVRKHGGKRFDPQPRRRQVFGESSIEPHSRQLVRRHDTHSNWRTQRGAEPLRGGSRVGSQIGSRTGSQRSTGVYTVDDSNIGSGAYFEGEWADDVSWMEEGSKPRMEEMEEMSDAEKSEGVTGDWAGAGKGNQ